MDQNETIRLLLERKSMRVFEEREIEKEKKQLILEAARQAATAGNMTLYTILDVTDPKLKETLSQTCDHQPMIAKAPMVLVFCSDYQGWYEAFCDGCKDGARTPGMGDWMLANQDALIAAQSAATAAESLGIGSCYIGDILEQYETHRKLFGLPDYVVPTCMLIFGYPTKQQKERKKPERLPLDLMVHENAYCLEKEQMRRARYREQNIDAFCKRKWNSAFSIEMTRSAKKMAERWCMCAEMSKTYDVRRIGESQIEEIYQLCKGNPLYYQHTKETLTEDLIREDQTALPPGKTEEDKWYVGFYEGRKLAAVMDLVFGYPQDDIAWIGFFMVDQEMQGKGVGTRMIDEMMAFLKTKGVRSVQLAYVQGNEQSRHFWQKQRFSETGKVTNRLVESGKNAVPCQVIVMERIL